jgi:hypothetical protein
MAIRIIDRQSGRVWVLNNLFDTVEIRDTSVVATTYLGERRTYPREAVDVEAGLYDQVLQLPNGNTFIRRS